MFIDEISLNSQEFFQSQIEMGEQGRGETPQIGAELVII